MYEEKEIKVLNIGLSDLRQLIQEAVNNAIKQTSETKKTVKQYRHIPKEYTIYTARVQQKLIQLGRLKDDAGSPKQITRKIIQALQRSHGLVLEQIMKDYHKDFGVDTANLRAIDVLPNAKPFDEVFECTLDDLIQAAKDNNEDRKFKLNVIKYIEPLAKALDDDSPTYETTYDLVFENMNCHWGYLSTRYKNKHRTKSNPTKLDILRDSPGTFKKYILTTERLLKESRLPRD